MHETGREATWDWIRFNLLRVSKCTGVQLERLQRRRSEEIYRRWKILRRERKALDRDKRVWFGEAPTPLPVTRPFCFNLYRMKRTWRDADRRNDLRGRPVDRTIGSTEARNNWSEILSQACDGDLVRIRHARRDAPAILIDERTFRYLEERAQTSAEVARGSGAASAAGS